MKVNHGDYCHELLVKNTRAKLHYKFQTDYKKWTENVREKFIELFGIDKIKQNVSDLNFKIDSVKDYGDYTLTEFCFDSELGATVPCYLLVPNSGKEKYPLAITLQGHSTGVHNSLGRVKFDSDKDYQPRGAFGLQAVKNGFASLCIEQRAMGELRSIRSYGENAEWIQRPHMCAFQSLVAISLGRTVLGERIWDVHKAIDVVVEYFSDKIDIDKILVTGNSGGGTISYYSACYDERIKYSVPSCSFCSFKSSILDVEHCACNYVPGLYEWFEMEDFSCLISPRPITIVAGEIDPIFPIEGVKESFNGLKTIYSNMGINDKVDMVITPKGHWWCEDLVWDRIVKNTKKMGW